MKNSCFIVNAKAELKHSNWTLKKILALAQRANLEDQQAVELAIARYTLENPQTKKLSNKPRQIITNQNYATCIWHTGARASYNLSKGRRQIFTCNAKRWRWCSYTLFMMLVFEEMKKINPMQERETPRQHWSYFQIRKRCLKNGTIIWMNWCSSE